MLDNPGQLDRPAECSRRSPTRNPASRCAAPIRIYAKQTPEEIVKRLLGSKGNIERRLTILFFAWRIGSDEEALTAWLEKHEAKSAETDVAKLFRAYNNPRLTLVDYAYLLGLHPLDLWCASEFRKNGELSWEELYNKGVEARRLGSAWLLNPRNHRAQDLACAFALKKTPSLA